MKHLRSWLITCCLLGGLATSVAALETDPFWSWGKPLPDVTDKLNAWVMVRLEDEIARANQKRNPQTCRSVRRSTIQRLRTLLIHDLDMWVSNSEWIPKQPGTIEDERNYRAEYLLADTHALDTATWLPPAPTLRVNGVRIGVDKLSHFFSEGWLYYRWSKRLRRQGLDESVIEKKVLERGMKWELTILGKTSSGIFSVADVEANHAGYLFWRNFCEGEEPLISANNGKLEINYRFDFRRYVTPNWDEAWSANIYSKSRWNKIKPKLLTYCSKLTLLEIMKERENYAKRDKQTLTEQIVKKFFEQGKFGQGKRQNIEDFCRDP